MKNSLQGFSSRCEQAEQTVNVKLCQLKVSTPREKKKSKKQTQNTRDTIKHANIHTMGVSKKREQSKGQKEYLNND